MLAGLLALALVLALRRDADFASPYTAGHAALVTATGERRLVEPRLSGGFAFGPWVESPSADVSPSDAELAAEVLVERDDSVHPASLGTRAVLQLRRGRPGEAIPLLVRGLEESPRDPRLRSDLAAAYLERADRDDEPRDLVAALDAAERAVALDDRLFEAAFNRALALERLHLWEVAAEAWEQVTEEEPNPGWREEARERLERLRSQPSAEERWQEARQRILAAIRGGDRSTLLQLVARHPQSCRQWVQDDLLGEWAEAEVGARRDKAAAAFATATALAEAHTAVSGDRLLSDALEAVTTAFGARRALLVEGHHLYRRAWLLHESKRYEEANPLFHGALEAFEAVGSPFAQWARLYLEIETYHRPDVPGALVELRDHANELTPGRHPVLAAHVHWMLGLARARRGPVVSGLVDWQTGRDLFLGTGETENRAAMDELIARVHSDLGNADLAWRHLIDALAARPALRKPRRIENILFNAVLTARALGDIGAAVNFQDEYLRQALRTADPLGVTIARRGRGELLTDLGFPEDAAAELDQALQTSAGIPDPGLRDTARSELLIARGRALCSFDPAQGLRDLSAAADFVSASDHRHLLLAVLLERARCHQARGDDLRAEVDLEAGLAEADRQQHLIADSEHRRYYLDRARELVEEAVRSAVERREAEASLITAERFRAAGLLQALGEPAPAAGTAVIAEALPPDTLLVEFFSLESELLAWIVTPTGTVLERVPIPRRDLEVRVKRFRGAIDRGEVPRDSVLEGELLGHLRPLLRDVTQVILVPDGPLYHLPFGALHDPATGEYLAETFALMNAPSARAWKALVERARRSSSGPPSSVLAIADVSFDTRLFADLPTLSGSASEAAAVTALYPRASRLEGTAATPARVLADLGRYQVAHVAAHAIDFPSEPELASLVLVPEPGRSADGLLPARDIRFPGPLRTRMVVLAACRSAGGTISATEGPLNLARPFLAAGVPAVVGSLWALDDATSLAFSSRFHAAYAGGAGALEAFHEAQLSLLRDPDPRLRSPQSWAGLVLMGADAGPLPPKP